MRTLWAGAARTGLGLVVVLGLVGGATLGCSGAGATVTQGLLELSAQVGLGGVIRPGLPFPLRLQASNGGTGLDGELRVVTRRARLDQPWSQVDELRLPLHLPAGARLAWNLTLSVDELVHPLVVEFWPRAAQGAEPLRLEVPLRPLAARERVLALVSARRLSLENELPIGPDVRVVELPRPESLPYRWDGWLAADWVVLDDIPLTSLAPTQVEALRLWVTAGGRLLVLPRAALAVPAGAEDLLPVTPLGRSLSLQETATELGRLPRGSTLFLSLSAPGTEILHSLAGIPLAARAPLGLGTTGWIGFDLADPALSPALRTALLQAGLGGERRAPLPGPGSGSALTWRSLRSVPVLPRSPLPLAALLAGHGLLAYLLVRWGSKSPHHLLPGIGALAAVASVLVASVPPALPEQSAAGVQVLEVSGGWGHGWGAWLFGQSQPSSTRLALGRASWQVGPLDGDRPEARTLLTLERDLGGYLWQGPGYLPATARWPLRLDLHLVAGGEGTWRVENRSPARLEMVLFYDGVDLLPLPDVPPGERLEVNPRDPFLRLGRIGVRSGSLAELRRWVVSRIPTEELTLPRTPLVTRALEEGWERLEEPGRPLPALLAFVEPSPTPDGTDPATPAAVVSLVILRPSVPGGGDGP